MNRTGPLVVFMLGCLAVLTADARELKASDAKALTYIWEVNLDEFNGAINVYSPNFTSWNGNFEEQWQLQLIPHGASDIRKDCLALYLRHKPQRETYLNSASEDLLQRVWHV
uniref:Glutamyl-tRNA(Gln) amidotransferase subunit A n=1 Tax=Lygus hesperus TaxID=30085 RepID=A0A0A9X9P3_LYGHE